LIIITQPQIFSSFNSAEQLHAALITWDKIDNLEGIQRQQKLLAGIRRRRENYAVQGSKTYNRLTTVVRKWANKIVPQLAENMPKDFVFVECVNNNKGGP
jgi:hypothetical protein